MDNPPAKLMPTSPRPSRASLGWFESQTAASSIASVVRRDV
jgi:hypothetical protein